jgi:hypothetical protein
MCFSGFLMMVQGTVLAAILLSCGPQVSDAAGRQGLSISIKYAGAPSTAARTLGPGTVMVPATYTMTGAGPNDASFTVTTIGDTVSESSLALGTWTIAVSANNASGTLIGTGAATAQVNNGEMTSVSISVIPISGTGTLSLGIQWPEAQVRVPSITASLTPALGSAQSIPFVISGATAAYSDLAIGNGYYVLSFALADDGIVVAGAVDAVRIVANQLTEFTYSISTVNVTAGSLQTSVNLELYDPLTVTITGASSPIVQSGSLSLVASVLSYSGSLTYRWYINGASDGAGETYGFGANKAFGHYRIDVVAFSADGLRAGGATTDIQVAVAGPAMVNLGTARDFAILGGLGVSIGAAGSVTGNIGLNADSISLVGFDAVMDSSNAFSTSTLVSGKLYAADYFGSTPSILATAYAEKTAASNDIASRPSADETDIGAGVLDGQVLAPGFYKWNGALSITNDITLDGGPNDVWIFRMDGGLTVGIGKTVQLTGGANPKNIFWYASGAASFGANARFEGILFSDSAIITGVGATVNGRLYAQTTVTLGGGSTVVQPSL